MKIIVMLLGALACFVSFGGGAFGMSESERCRLWVSNAMYGATQSMRGAAREVEFVPISSVATFLTRSGSKAADKLYIFFNEGDSAADRDEAEQSILFGYDAMSRWQSLHAGQAPSRDAWRQNLMATCLDQGVA